MDCSPGWTSVILLLWIHLELKDRRSLQRDQFASLVSNAYLRLIVAEPKVRALPKALLRDMLLMTHNMSRARSF